MDKFDPIQLERGVFTVSIDFEMIWGTISRHGPEAFRTQCEEERRIIIDRLLALLTEFEVPATWLVVGHLFLDSCNRNHRTSQIDSVLSCIPSNTIQSGDMNSLFCARDLVRKIQACNVPQEIGCHTFSHAIFTKQTTTRERAEAELAACVSLARELGIVMRSFVFPENRIGYLDLLREHRFTCYRGAEWHERGHLPDLVRRLTHLWLVCTAASPPVHLPEFGPEGVWNIPGSMMYFPMHGRRRHLPLSLRVNRAGKGLEAAAQQNRIFHLWFHPTNLADETESMFAGLRSIFQHAARLRESGCIDFKSMGSIVVDSLTE